MDPRKAGEQKRYTWQRCGQIEDELQHNNRPNSRCPDILISSKITGNPALSFCPLPLCRIPARVSLGPRNGPPVPSDSPKRNLNLFYGANFA
jgi:hypothetical protein